MNIKTIAVLAGFAVVGSLLGVAICGWKAKQAAAAAASTAPATAS
jgi:hypothetical protein